MLRTTWWLSAVCLIVTGAEQYETPALAQRSTELYMPTSTEGNKKVDHVPQKTGLASGTPEQRMENIFGDSYKFGKVTRSKDTHNKKETIQQKHVNSENMPEKRYTNRFSDTWDDIDLEEEPFDSDISGIDRKRFVMRNAYLRLVKSMESLNDKLYAAHRNLRAQNNMGVTKRPLIYGSATKTGERPFIFGPGWRPGKRAIDGESVDFTNSKYLNNEVIPLDAVSDGPQSENNQPNLEMDSKNVVQYQNEVDAIEPLSISESESTIEKQPFVFDAGRFIGERDPSMDNLVDKSPFVVSSEEYFGERNNFRQGNDDDILSFTSEPLLGKPQSTVGLYVGQVEPIGFDSESYVEKPDPINSHIHKRPFVFGSGKYFGKRGSITKRPFVFGSGRYFGKRGDLDQISEMKKRPFVFSSGNYFGKRDISENEVEKRPFVFGSGKYFGKRGTTKYEVEKRPFIFGSGKYFGKRGIPQYEVDKRPFVFGSGKYFGKRRVPQYEVEKRPFVFGSGKYFGKRGIPQYEVDKRPFVFGSGKYFGKRGMPQYEVDKRPFVFGSGKYFGKRGIPQYEVDKRPFVFGSGKYFGKRDPYGYENNLFKRPFVLGSGKYFGKRDHLENSYEIIKKPFVFGTGRYFGKRNFLQTDNITPQKRPFVFGNGKYFGKRNTFDNSLNKAFTKRPAFGTVYGGRFKFGKRQPMDAQGMNEQFLTEGSSIYS